ncbi:ATP-grasp domain-containing protein [Legionella spiritensis]|uniref:Tubulin-tyrosine ligase family protein n=1 Tax=Legionella spiritensis TaxID=452 RepID=A0A0W0Z6M7_LEGSP|nr:hypothetical protein [Legionella spiritensis]KTD64765.1 Tubulin-tyrosine ligase family protein [Legionella spiritensis]SNV48270.1 Tubulin-tyrosine ligase family [Legionella spiritensis]
MSMKPGTRRYCLAPEQSPTHYNLSRLLRAQGWIATRFAKRAGFGETNLHFDEAAAQCLEYKHRLAALVTRYCPEVMPETHSIDDHNWPGVLNRLADRQGQSTSAPETWILKPSLLNNGQQIKIFQSIGEIERHYLNPRRLGGIHVLQRYITNPQLLRDDRKYSIRLFVILTNYAGSYLYQDGYFNVALSPYSRNGFTDLRPHLTNEHLHESDVNVLQIPSRRFAFFAAQMHQIEPMVSRVLAGLNREFPQAFQCGERRRMAIFGFDFMADDTGRLWLLEANHGPCFPVEDEHPLQRYLYDDFWQAFIDAFVTPVADNAAVDTIRYSGFSRV